MCVSRTWLSGVLTPACTPPHLTLCHTYPLRKLTPTRRPLRPSPAHETSGLGPAASPMSSAAPCPLLTLAFPQRAHVLDDFSGQPAPPAVAEVPYTSPVLDPHTARGPTGAEDTGGAAIPGVSVQGQEGLCAHKVGEEEQRGPWGGMGRKGSQLRMSLARQVPGEMPLGIREALTE